MIERTAARIGTQIRMLRSATTHADAFGAEPVEPAQAVFALLLAATGRRAGQQPPPVLAHDLQAAKAQRWRCFL